MTKLKLHQFRVVPLLAAAFAFVLAGCETLPSLPPAPLPSEIPEENTEYRIGSDDSLQIFVWRNPELSTSVSVRPDGMITIPLIEDLPAVGRTPTALAREIEEAISVYIQDPIVTVIVRGFVGLQQHRIRVVGEAARPQALPYRSTMTLMDVMIAVGGITDFAAGNRATISRVENGEVKRYRVRIDDLLKAGDLSANVRIQPGDIITIPETWF